MSAPISTTIVKSDELSPVPSPTNPHITKLGLFSDFAGGYLVSGDIFFVPKGEACVTHNNRGAVKLFVVMEGEGIIEVDGVGHTVKTDDCVIISAGAMYRLIGASDTPPFKVLAATTVAPQHEDDTEPWTPTA